MTVTIDGTNGVTTPDVEVSSGGSASAPAITVSGDTNTGIFFPAADTIAFAEGGAEAMRIDSSGNVGIGTSSPAEKLVVSGAIASAGQLADLRASTTVLDYNSGNIGRIIATGPDASTYPAIVFANTTTTTYAERARITSGGYFKASFDGTYINSTGTYHEFTGETANGYTLRARCTNASPANHYVGDFRFTAASPNNTGAFFIECRDSTAGRIELRSNGGIANYSANNVNLSDRREKNNFAPAKNYLDTICAIPVQTFNYIDQNLEEDDGLTLGVVAQDVQEVAPELVMESNWASKDEEPKMRLSIYQTDLQYALMKSIQELKAINDAQASRIETLEAKVAALEQA